MDLRDALHTMARRHCMERYEHWVELYRQLEVIGQARQPTNELEWAFTDEAYSTFPRYLVWQAIRDEVERLDTRLKLNVDGLRDELVAAGRRAQTPLTSNPGLPVIANVAMAEEREKFACFVRSVPENELNAVEPLSIRRVFGKEELGKLWQMLDARWEIKKHQHWWPLQEGTAPPDLLIFHEDWFDSEKEIALLEILKRHGVEKVLELREFGEWGCEETVDTLKPVYTGEEGYWTSTDMDWLVYASHESSITLAGEWLVGDFREYFPDWEQFVYDGPISTSDQRGTWSW